jgi:hypothetical protein
VETARCTHRNENNDYVGCKILKRRNCLEDHFIDGWIILKCNLKNWVSGYKLDLHVSGSSPISNITSHLNTLISKIIIQGTRTAVGMMTSLWAG